MAGEFDEEEDAQGDDDNKKIDRLGNQIVGEPQIDRVTYALNVFIYKGAFAKIPGIKELNARYRIIIKEGEFIDSLVLS